MMTDALITVWITGALLTFVYAVYSIATEADQLQQNHAYKSTFELALATVVLILLWFIYIPLALYKRSQ